MPVNPRRPRQAFAHRNEIVGRDKLGGERAPGAALDLDAQGVDEMRRQRHCDDPPAPHHDIPTHAFHPLGRKPLPPAGRREMTLDAIAAGIEPHLATFYLQSAVPEVAELYGLLQSLATVSRLERIPSLKDMAQDANVEMTFALLGYPVLQAADIFCVRANIVPVARDNRAHVEVAREIARRFNHLYGEALPLSEGVDQPVCLVAPAGRRMMTCEAPPAIRTASRSTPRCSASTARRPEPTRSASPPEHGCGPSRLTKKRRTSISLTRSTPLRKAASPSPPSSKHWSGR